MTARWAAPGPAAEVSGSRAARPGARLRSGLATVLAVGAALLLAAGAAFAVPASTSPGTVPGPVGPAEPTVVIEITALEPAVPQPGDVLVIEGSVTNTSDLPMHNVQALFRHNLNPLGDRHEIRDLDTDPRRLWGSRPGHVFDEVTDLLTPGSSADFLLEMRVDTTCPLPEPGAVPCVQIQHPGVYVVGVDVREGDPNVPRARVDAGTALTFLPWLADLDADPEPVQVAMLWPLVSTPATLAGSDMTADGPLQTMVDAPGTAPVTWLVDASLLDTDSDGSGDGVGIGDRIRAAGSGAQTWLLPYARPDLGAFEPGTAERLAGDSLRMAAAVGVRLPGARGGVVWPTGGTVSPDTLAIFDNSGARTAILSSGAFDPVASGPWVAVDGFDMSAVVTDAGLDATIRSGGASGIGLRQRWLAETALAAIEGERAMVTGPPADWRPGAEEAAALIDVWMSTPWIEPVALDDLTEAIADDVTGSGLPTATLAAAPDQVVLPAGNAEATANLISSADQYRTLVGNEPGTIGTGGTDPVGDDRLDTAPVRSASAAWQADPAAGLAYAETITAQLDELLSQVAVQVAPTVTLSSNTGAFPVNVANGLDVPVTVRLDLDSANPDRMSIEPIVEQRIEAGETEIVRVTAEAVANGRVRVDIQLATIDGVPLGEARNTVVNATDYGIIGWFLIAGASLLFVAGLAVRTVRGRRRNGSAEAPPVLASTPLDEVSR